MDHNLWMHMSDGQRGQATVVEDWVKERSTTPAATSGQSSSSVLDLDFINEMGLSTPGPSSSSLYIPSSQFGNYYVPPYNTMPYGSSSWTSSSTLPLSSYSSLNGATTSTATSSSSQSHQSPPQVQAQRQHSPPEPTMVIDPVLTSMSGSNTSSPNKNHQYSQSPPPQSTSTAYSYPQYSSLSSFMPHLYSQTQPQQQQQHSPPSQGTLSPQALHAASPSSLLNAITPSQFYGQLQQSQPHPKQEQQSTPLPTQQSPQPVASGSGLHHLPPPQQSTPQPQGPTPEQRRQQLYTSIKPLLLSSAFTGAQAVNTLVQRLDDFGSQDVDASLRMEILTKIRDGAGNHYFRAWGENSTALDITREWLKAAYTAKEGDPLAETTMPLLHIIDRLPLTLESLKGSKLGKVVVKIVKEPPTPAIKDMASNVERRWRLLVESASKTNGHNTKDTQDPKGAKKRKEPASSTNGKIAPPAKKAAVGSSTASKPSTALASASTIVKAAGGAGVKDAKSDSGFFSAPKPKPKLPTFKKAPPTSNNTSTLDSVAQPSSIDPFQEVLKSMGKARPRSQSPAAGSTSAATATPPSTTNTPPLVGSTSVTGLTKSGKKKKSVTWAPQESLESIKWIEKVIYDGDPSDATHHHSLRDLDRGEGAALHAHLFEETLDWSEPPLIEIPIDIECPPRGEGSLEKNTQEQREKTALVAVYLNPAHVPESPGEPATTLPDEEVDKDVTVMTCGPEVDGVFFSEAVPQPQETAASSVADLVAQLATGNTGITMNGIGASGSDSSAGGFGTNGTTVNGFNNGLGGMRTKIVDLEGEYPFVNLNINTSCCLDAMAAIQQHMQTLTPEQMQMLLQQLNPAGGSASFGDNWQQPGGQGQFSDFGYQDETGSGDRSWADTGSGIGGRGGGRGGGGSGSGGRFRGRGRGGGDGGGFRHNKRKPCNASMVINAILLTS
ncbi:hypothetical protein WG66_008559 [Moniliophthora roreri]|nr:hypothetical protein WG66_008559 [Moniliophthora roreri]